MKRISLAFSLLVLAGCQTQPSTQTATPANINVIKQYFNGNNAFVYTRDVDNTTGAAAIVDLTSLKVLAKGIGEGSWFSNDVVFQSDSRYIYIIDRANANITVVDPLNGGKEIKQVSVGAGTDPQSVVRMNGKLYVSRTESASMLVLDADTFAQVGTVDLSAFSSPDDGKPEMSFAVTAEGQVWVALQRADQTNYWAPTTQPFAGSFVVSIDPSTNKVDKQVKLLGVAPYQMLKVDPLTGDLMTISSLNNATGIETVDPRTAKSTGWLVEPAKFPEGIFFAEATTSDVYVVSGEGFQGYTLYDWNYTVLWAIDRKTGAQKEVARSDAGYFGLSCLELSPGLSTDATQRLLISCAGPGTRVTKPGLRVFDTRTLKELTTSPLNTGLAPFGVTFFARPQTEVVSEPATEATK